MSTTPNFELHPDTAKSYDMAGGHYPTFIIVGGQRIDFRNQLSESQIVLGVKHGVLAKKAKAETKEAPKEPTAPKGA